MEGYYAAIGRDDEIRSSSSLGHSRSLLTRGLRECRVEEVFVFVMGPILLMPFLAFGLNCLATSVTSVNTLWLPRYLRSKHPYAGHNTVSDLLNPVTLPPPLTSTYLVLLMHFRATSWYLSYVHVFRACARTVFELILFVPHAMSPWALAHAQPIECLVSKRLPWSRSDGLLS